SIVSGLDAGLAMVRPPVVCAGLPGGHELGDYTGEQISPAMGVPSSAAQPCMCLTHPPRHANVYHIELCHVVCGARCGTVPEEAGDAQCVDLYRCLRQLSVQRLTPAEAVSPAAYACAHAELRTPPTAAEPRVGDDPCGTGRTRTLSYSRVRPGARGS